METDTAAVMARRDYSLVGADARQAVERGLASGAWYAHPVPRKQLKALMKRKDGPALRDTAIWIGALLLSGGLGVALWGSWLAVPCLAVYGVLYGSASDSRWHECGHGTAFRTRWMNDVVYQLACFMIMREPTVWRWSHTRHHTNTIIVGRDPEIAVPRPPDIAGLLLDVFALRTGARAIGKLVLHAGGRLTAAEATFIPASECGKVAWTARGYLAILAGVAAPSIGLRSWLPAMLVGLPTLYGAWLSLLFGLTQHAGLSEDVLDHRLNSRTILMNPVSRFLYWRLLLATGARPRRLSIPGAEPELPYLRTFADALAMRARLRDGNRLMVIGGGFIGLEIAAGAVARAVRSPWSRRRRASSDARSPPSWRRSSPNAIAARASGCWSACSLPASSGRARSGWSCSRTAVALAARRSSPGSARSRTRRWRRLRLEAWRNARDQGRHAARSMLGATAPYDEVPWFWSDQHDRTLQIAGLSDEGDSSVVRELADASIRFHLKAGRLVAASGFGPNGSIAREIRLAELLVRERAHPDPARLADASVRLKSLLARQAVAA